MCLRTSCSSRAHACGCVWPCECIHSIWWDIGQADTLPTIAVTWNVQLLPSEHVPTEDLHVLVNNKPQNTMPVQSDFKTNGTHFIQVIPNCFSKSISQLSTGLRTNDFIWASVKRLCWYFTHTLCQSPITLIWLRAGQVCLRLYNSLQWELSAEQLPAPCAEDMPQYSVSCPAHGSHTLHTLYTLLQGLSIGMVILHISHPASITHTLWIRNYFQE